MVASDAVTVSKTGSKETRIILENWQFLLYGYKSGDHAIKTGLAP
ncbi:MAG: hypothetical protein V1735_02360 [Nanoarchaeota archaeon]